MGESTSSTNERPHTRFSMYPASAIRQTKLQFSRATMAHLVHILGIMDPSCEIKKGDAGKPALHETLVQTDKEWRGAVRGRKRAERRSAGVAFCCHQLSNFGQLLIFTENLGHVKSCQKHGSWDLFA